MHVHQTLDTRHQTGRHSLPYLLCLLYGVCGVVWFGYVGFVSISVALQQIGAVIRNPEIGQLVPILLEAIVKPDVNSQAALHAVIHTCFTHSVRLPVCELLRLSFHGV